MSGQRKALIIAVDEYEQEALPHLLAPAADAEALGQVLSDPQIGDFTVQVVRNEPAHVIQAQIEDLFAEGRSDDVLLLHFSCHGLKSESGELFFAAANTRLNRLVSTAIPADFVQRCMRASRSRSIVLLLDCCYGGAFSQGVAVRAAGDVNVLDSFAPERLGGGRGRAVITASSAMEYAFEGEQLTDVHATPRPSVFTAALVEGLASGEADRDEDGLVSLNELYDYVFDKVREQNPHQTPSRDVETQGELYIARRGRPVTTPAPLPPELQQAIDHPLAGIRAGAVQELVRVMRARHAGLALAARLALEQLAGDDSRAVAAAAAAALNADAPPAAAVLPPSAGAPKLPPAGAVLLPPAGAVLLPPAGAPELSPAGAAELRPKLALSATIIDFGRISALGPAPERRVRLDNAGGGTLNARPATEASWLKLRQEGDEVVLTLDTGAAGEHDGVVSIDSDGGSAAIRVRARIDPAPLPAADTAATAPEAAPAPAPEAAPAPERARPGPPRDAANPQEQPAPAAIRASRWPPAMNGLRRKRDVSHELHAEGSERGGGQDLGQRTGPPLRSRITAAAAAVAAVLVLGGGAFLISQLLGSGSGGGSGSPAAAPAVPVPGCTTRTATTNVLPVHPTDVPVAGNPFGVEVGRGARFSQFSFVSTGSSVAMLSNNGGGPNLSPFSNIPAPGAQKGEAITGDGHLLVAGGSGAVVISIGEAEQHAADPVLGHLTSTGAGAVDVALSPDDKYAFVTLQDSNNMAVFNLDAAVHSGFGKSEFVGFVPLDSQPVGIAQSGDLLYVTSWGTAPSQGTVSVVSMKRAETPSQQATAVLATHAAGCRPSRLVTTSADGGVVWVTAQQSNALLAFSAAELRAKGAHPLIASVPVGPDPIGEKVIKGGAQIAVANSGSPSSLMVVDTRKALAGKPALVGRIPAGSQPHEFNQNDLEGGKTLLVTNRGSGQLEALSINDIP
ncbi:MAG TPA: caspase family protein [Streptosporangiaceae bacterium]|nr:caspase family protein [Streptosporangiaceae bacterium]